MTTATAARVELKIPSRPEFISVARLAVAAVANRMGFDFDDIEDLKVATGEALANAIQHAQLSGRESDEYIVVVCAMEAQALVIEVRDSGAGFDPERRRQELEEKEELGESGMGLLLIEALMDGVDFKTKPGKGTSVRMTKRLSGS